MASDAGWLEDDSEGDETALTAVARGTSPEGDRWTIHVGGTPDNCLTMLEIEQANGTQTGGGGLGGPALYNGRMMNVSWHRTDSGFGYLVGRVHPSVTLVRIRLTGTGMPAFDLTPDGDPSRFGVRYIAAVLPTGSLPATTSAFDALGRLLDEQDHSGQMRALDRPRDERRSSGRHGGGWWSG